MRVGFIGLGMMGKGMAANLQKAGHQLVVHDLNRAAAEPFLAKGAEWADSPRAVAASARRSSSPRCRCRPMSRRWRSGPNGLIEGMKPDTAFFDMSTNSVAVVRKISAAFAEKNLYMLDSPVSGGPGGAASGKMAIWVGGDEQQFNRHKSVLDAMGDQARYIGPIGAGTIAKLVHNCTSAVVGRGARRGHDDGHQGRGRAARIVGGGAPGRDRPAAHLRPARQVPLQQLRSRRFRACACCTRTCRWRSGSASEVGVPMRLANLALEELTEAMNRGWGTARQPGRRAAAGRARRDRRSSKVDPAKIQAVLDADK